MADTNALVAEVLAHLATIPGVLVSDGQVPAGVPQTGAYIDPYIILWAGAGDGTEDVTACGDADTDTTIWDFQTNVVAASVPACRAVANLVGQALTNARTGTGKVRPNPGRFNIQAPIPDPDNQTSPVRYTLPLQWRLITN